MRATQFSVYYMALGHGVLAGCASAAVGGYSEHIANRAFMLYAWAASWGRSS
ncbi:MAG: hypothetical protein HY906_26010 [Deltaproteobacteria bacterium]|nr:hypothetical protein [Deltaproteobacteria bacterium]